MMPEQTVDSDNMGLPEDYAAVCTVPHRMAVSRYESGGNDRDIWRHGGGPSERVKT